MRASSILFIGIVTGPSAAFVACAESDPTSSAEDSGTPPPTTPDSATGDSGPDVASNPCDAGDPGCTSVSLPCDATAWCPVEVPGPKHTLNAVWGTSATDVWAAGAGGAIAHWDGAIWATVSSGTTYTLNAIGGTGSSDVWVVSTPHVLVHCNGYEGPATRCERAPPIATGFVFSSLLRSVWNPPGTDAIVVGGDWIRPEHGGALFRTAREPVEWITLLASGQFRVRGIWGSSADDVWVVGQPDTMESDFEASALHGVAGADGAIAEWTASNIQSVTLEAVWGTSATDVWTVGRRGTIRHFTGAPSGWSVVPSPTTRDLHAVWGTSSSDVWIAGDGGVLLHWNGSEWQTSNASYPIGPNPTLYGIWGSGPNDVWAVGEQRTVLHYTGTR